jgi:hypothetical protein
MGRLEALVLALRVGTDADTAVGVVKFPWVRLGLVPPTRLLALFAGQKFTVKMAPAPPPVLPPGPDPNSMVASS